MVMRSYDELIRHVMESGGNISYIGRTFLGYPIPMISKGEGSVRVLVVASVHAREFITSFLAFKLFESYNGDVRFDLVPCLNIDGVILSRCGVNGTPLSLKDREFLLSVNKNSKDFSLWKANARAVDINLNFDAGFGKGLGNLKKPAPHGYIGKKVESEPETKAIAKLIRENDYKIAVAYHSKGEEVYWGFKDDTSYEAEAQEFANFLGYKLKETRHSTGGIKDYFTLHTKQLGLTVEVGDDNLAHPLSKEILPSLVEKHTGSWELLAELAKQANDD